MTVDISRVSFVPRKNYAGTIEQQGRVALDADGNEGWAIQDRRWRSETYDLAGRVHVPIDVPDSFRIDVVGGNLTIDPGRLYVDGLQAENHGAAPAAFDPVLAELRDTAAIRFDQQPYRPGFTPPAPAPGRHVIYLDVWQRTVTPIEDPSLIESAVGVDTTGRVQTVWQVRDLADVGDADCSTPDADLPGWTALTDPSAGRLSSRAHIGPPIIDPCLLPPGSGYTGLENRTYRVVVHDESPAGTFRFKWAMYDATVASPILSLPAADTLRVARVARDDVLRFNPGDWVEITDDRGEFEALPGVMAQVQAVDDAAETITLAAALPAGTLVFDGGGPDLDQQFHPRVRKWDQAGAVRDSNGNLLVDLNVPGSSGLIEAPPSGTWVVLNDGVEVSFDLLPAGGRFRPGDYWIFTARTVGRQVEELVEAAPLGIHHHYCRLAVVDADAGGWVAPIVEDCRPHPVDTVGCCTVVIRPGESIQAAIDSLPPAGGCVCLKSGVHPISAPILIRRDNVSLHGESRGAIVQGIGISLIIIGGQLLQGTRIHSIRFRQLRGTAPVITIRSAFDVVIADCDVATSREGTGGGIGLFALNTGDLTVESCTFTGMTTGIWLTERSVLARIAHCDINLGSVAANAPTTVGVLVEQTIGAVTIIGNRIGNAVNGIVINDRADAEPFSLATGSHVRDNAIALVAPPGDLLGRGIDVACAQAVIAGNRIEHPGGRVNGIRICGDAGLVDGNTVRSTAELFGLAGAIVAGFQANQQFLPLDRAAITHNIIDGPQSGIAVIGVTRAQVSGNFLGRSGATSGFGIALNAAHDCIVADNELVDALAALFAVGGTRNRLSGNVIGGGSVGILLGNELGPTIAGNRVTGVLRNAVAVLGATQRCVIVENRLVSCGSAMPEAVAIGVSNLMGELHIEANEVMDTGLPVAAGAPAAAVARGISCDMILEARVQSNLVTYSDITTRAPNLEDRALRMRGLIDAVVNTGNTQTRMGFGIQIADNKFIGAGATALVELLEQTVTDTVIIRFERVQFCGNYCLHSSLPFNDALQAATVSLVGRRCSVANNHVKASTPQFRSYHFHGMPGPFIGNVSNAGNLGRVAANVFPAPENAFNMLA